MKKKNEIISFKNFIIIGSFARNAGKTEFACKIISRNSKKSKIIAIKVKRVCINKENCDNLCKHCRVGELPEHGYVIIEEKNISGKKDTSKMLNAGASKVFFLQCRKDKLKEGFLHLLKKIPKNTVVVCESNGIREFLKPGLYVVIKNMHVDNIKESCVSTMHLADKIIEFHDMQWNFQPDRIVHKNNTWMLKEQATAIILAGGESDRMHGDDKSLLPVNGKPLISHIISQIKDYFDQIIISANDKQKFAFLELPVISDMEKDKGPLMGILSCLKVSNNNVNFITACDIPIMNIKFIKKMIKISDNYDIVIPVSKSEYYEPLYAVYKKSVIPYAESLLNQNKRKITDILDCVNSKKIEFAPNLWYKNLNKKNDYQDFINNYSDLLKK